MFQGQVKLCPSSVADPDPPDPHVLGLQQSEVWIRILLSSCKNSKKNLDYYYFVTLFDFLSLMYLQKVISRIFLNQFFVDILKVNDKNSGILILLFTDPDPLVRGMDPGISIPTKMSWIRNTVSLIICMIVERKCNNKVCPLLSTLLNTLYMWRERYLEGVVHTSPVYLHGGHSVEGFPTVGATVRLLSQGRQIKLFHTLITGFKNSESVSSSRTHSKHINIIKKEEQPAIYQFY